MSAHPIKAIQPIFNTKTQQARTWEVNQFVIDQPMFFEDDRRAESAIEALDVDNLNFILEYLEIDERVCLSANIRMNMLRGNYAQIMINLLMAHSRVLHRLTLEVVEHGFNGIDRRSSLDEVKRNLELLSSMGVALSLDDYGAGHSSAGLLTWDSWREVKIDGSIVVNAVHPSRFNRSRIVLKNTTELLHELGFVVIFECIENQSMLDMAHELNADGVQGFFLQRPVTISDGNLAKFFAVHVKILDVI
jgi:EAL domain-containing protein (putative c-di-GMP-specific phosphodiesterase class I)